MSVRSSQFLAYSVLALAGLMARPAAAQDSDSDGPEAKGDKKDVEDEAPPPKKKKSKKDESTPPESGESSAAEEPGQTYYFVGARYRGIIIPKFMMNLFGDGGRALYIHSFGPEFGIRKDGFEYNLGLWYAAYTMDKTPFKASSDGVEAWEIVWSDLKVIFLTADFLWSHELSPEFAINYGLGAGLGFVFGELHRNQAYPPYANADPYHFSTCVGPGNPNVYAPNGAPYCDSNPDHNHYGNYTESSWANGGSKPIVFPWLALQTGLRYKPHRNFASRLDVGFGTSGFFLGVGLDYGI
jgi:hypothetical protein